MRSTAENITLLFAAILVSWSFSSCEKKLDIELPDHTPELVVNAIFTPDSAFQVEVSRTKSLTDPRGVTYISNATVEIYEDNMLMETLPYRSVTNLKGVYKAEGAVAKANRSYTVKVRAPGYQAVTATNVVPEKVDIVGAELQDIRLDANSIKGNLVVNFQEPEDQANAYHLIIYRPIIRLNDQSGLYEVAGYYEEYFKTEEVRVTENYDVGVLFTDEGCNGQKKEIVCEFNGFYDASRDGLDHFIVELRSVSDDYYRYHKSYTEQQNNFNNKIVDVYTNVEDGYGIFAGYHSSYYTIFP